MKTFLDQLTQEILAKDGNDFSDLCVVLPNRRAGVFLRDALSRAGQRTIWAPSILSIEDLVFRLSDQVKVDQTTLLFMLFRVYQQEVKDAKPFEQFANWAPTFLADVNEVDINLIDAEDIYSQLYSVERIARWNPSGKPMTDTQKAHLEFVKTLFPLYSALRQHLQAENLAYQGLAFHHVAENIPEAIARCEWKRIWFAGFNALTGAEEKIIQTLSEEGLATVFWDMDPHYADDPMHEAGHYFRRYASGRTTLKLEKDLRWKLPHLSTEPKEVTLIAAQRNVSQAEAASTILYTKWKEEGADSFRNTAVVLNDEKMLFPLLNSMPAELDGVNVTMGYGLKYSQMASFIDKLFQLYIGSERAEGKYYHLHVLDVCTHSVFSSISGQGTGEVKKWVQKLNRVQIPAEELWNSEFGKLIFSKASPDASSFLELVSKVCRTVRQTWDEEQFVLESKFVVLIERLIRRLKDLQREYSLIDSLKTLQVFWHQLLKTQQLDFVGEPIGGLQIMGMLETRNLDFEEVIMLSVNEGSLPSNSHSPSYFTFDVRRAFGLACQNERDAVTAYHFYRLIQRAKKVILVYDQDMEAFGGGEVSRFVQQLKLEAPKNVTIKELHLKQHISKQEVQSEIEIEKDDAVYAKLLYRAENGLSPSALNTYRSCPLKYYLRYVADFKEPTELAEDVDHAMFGTAIHKTLQQLYSPFIGKPLTEEGLKAMRKELEGVLEGHFAEHIPSESVKQGKNLLAFEVAKTYVDRVLKYDLDEVADGNVATILQMEQELTGTLELQANGETIDVKIKGDADRVDRLPNGVVRLIDYKTGSADKKIDIAKPEDFDNTKADYAFQLLMYRLMYAQETGNGRSEPYIFFLRLQDIAKEITVSEEKMRLSGAELSSYTEERLKTLLSELLNREVPFCQTEQLTTCAYCEFKHMCDR